MPTGRSDAWLNPMREVGSAELWLPAAQSGREKSTLSESVQTVAGSTGPSLSSAPETLAFFVA